MTYRLLKVCATAFLMAASICPAAGQEKPVSAAAQPAQILPANSTLDNPSSSQPVLAQRYPRYLLRPSDVIQITFPITPEFDQTISIQPDGFVNLRGVGDLYIAGKTVPEFSESLHKLYGHFLNDPIINIEMKDFEKPYFTAGGEFGRPGKYELRGDTTVAEAVAIAGGFTEKAKHSNVLVFRRVPGGWEVAKRLDVKQMIVKGDLGEDIHLRPGDLIYVPKSSLSKIKDFIPSPGMGFAIP
jgi:polysaccharide export outer membrane protein